MNRRSFLGAPGALLTGTCFARLRIARAATSGETPFARVRPGEPGWPSQAQWDGLSNTVSGRLVRIDDPLATCRRASEGPACQAFFKEMKNPYSLSENPALTETSGWVDAWSSAPSAYAVKVRSTAEVGGGQFCAGAQIAPGHQGRRPQLSGHLGRARFAADLDAGDERDHPP
jgi:hypothetical protein